MARSIATLKVSGSANACTGIAAMSGASKKGRMMDPCQTVTRPIVRASQLGIQASARHENAQPTPWRLAIVVLFIGQESG